MASRFMKARKMRQRHTKEYRELNREDDRAWRLQRYQLAKTAENENTSHDPLWPEEQYEKPVNLKSETQMEVTGRPSQQPARTEAVKPQSLVEGTPGFL